MNITVIGGGNVGHYLLALAGSKGHEMSLYTSKPDRWSNCVESFDTVKKVLTKGHLTKASNNSQEVISGADMILVALPSHVYEKVFVPIKKYIKNGAIVGFIPGTGGVEFFCDDLIERGCILFGTQRVPSGTSVVEYGKRVNSLGSRRDLRVATIPGDKVDYICGLLHSLLDIETVSLPNYLSVTLTPSNPILHTSRLSTLFAKYKKGDVYDKQLSFYKEWTDDSSEMLIGCDEELQQALQKIPLSTEDILSLKVHYEIWTVDGKNDIERMSRKINILPYLKDKVPMIKVDAGFIPDFSSRYFLEDFPYGLCIVKSFCDICKVKTPHIDWVLKWFCTQFGCDFFAGDKFEGKDLRQLYLPVNYGLRSVNDIVKFYSR